jgi:hypothetical protein
MEKLVEVVIGILEVIGNFIFPNRSKIKEELPPIPGEPFILLILVISFSIIAILLSQIIKIDKKLYFSLVIILILLLTFIFYFLIRKIYYFIVLNKVK